MIRPRSVSAEAPATSHRDGARGGTWMWQDAHRRENGEPDSPRQSRVRPGIYQGRQREPRISTSLPQATAGMPLTDLRGYRSSAGGQRQNRWTSLADMIARGAPYFTERAGTDSGRGGGFSRIPRSFSAPSASTGRIDAGRTCPCT